MNAGRAHGLRVEDLGTSRTVLLMVDFINPLDFEGSTDLKAPAIRAARTAARLRKRLSREGCRTIYANDNYGGWNSDFATLWQNCARRGGASGDLARALRPRKKDFSILKPRHSAFYSTPLDLLLQQLGCRRVVVTGLATDSCVLFTAMDAYLRGYELWIPSDATAAESEQAKQQALAHMAAVLKADIRPTALRGAAHVPRRLNTAHGRVSKAGECS